MKKRDNTIFLYNIVTGNREIQEIDEITYNRIYQKVKNIMNQLLQYNLFIDSKLIGYFNIFDKEGNIELRYNPLIINKNEIKNCFKNLQFLDKYTIYNKGDK